MKQLLFIAFLCVLLPLNTNSEEKIYDWRGEGRNGVYNESNLLKAWPENGPSLLWAVDSGLGSGYSSPMVTDKYIYIAGMIDSTGHMFCYDLEGRLVWDVEYGKEWNNKSFPGARSTPVIKGDDLYTLSGQGLALKMNALNGEIIWTVDIKTLFDAKPPVFGFCESPLLVDDNVIFTPAGNKGALVALKQRDGALVWASPGRGDVSAYCSATYFEHNKRKVVATMTHDYLMGVDYETGDTLWTYHSYKNWTDNCNTPKYLNGELFISSPYGEGSRTFILNDDATEITLKWSNQEFDNQIGGVVELNGFYYGLTVSKKKWMCVDKNTGETKWSERGVKIGSIISADNMLYCYGDDGDLALVQATPDTFNIVSKFKVFDGKQQFTHPVIADGKLYMRYQEGLKVFDIRK